jgi:hypothetical protein
MRTIHYTTLEWNTVWDRLAKDYTALSMGKELGFKVRRQVEMIECQDAPVGVEKATIHLDFERDADYTLFLLKYR